MAEQAYDPLKIDASPTKELFIEMLTRDVALVPAIIDLADNCTDGARRLRNEKSWDGLFVTVDAHPQTFVITDNCGGMSVEIAREYAFRFGRPSDTSRTKGEVGRFGVGMKRGLFKLGRHFHIRSTTARTQFDATIDVDKWKQKTEWEFKFDNEPTEDGKFAPEEQGTTITVTRLHPQVHEHFEESGFIEELRRLLTLKLEKSIRKGIAVKVNGVHLKAHVRSLVATDALAPAKKTFKLKGPSGGSVEVELWCGLGKPESQATARGESGWYVFCNGRMLLEADKTTATGWGTEDDETIPAHHTQFNDFRGLAYLEAADAADLPWNTMKTALDTDHPVYRTVRQQMIALARPVIDYFNKRKKENEAMKDAGEVPRGVLQTLFDGAVVKPVENIKARSVFIVPTPKAPKASKTATKMRTIPVVQPADKAERVRQSTGANTWKQVGERIFDYYYKAECKDV